MAEAALPFPAEHRVLTVGELTREIKRLLEDEFPFVMVTGEISNHRLPQAGHRYFTLKDEQASLSCVVWHSAARFLRFEPEDGMEVIAWGRVEVYEPHGKYQLIVEGIEPRGVGALQIRFEQLKEKLQHEGLFEPARKRALPFLPEKIAIVTSPTGAAIQDMLRTIFSRFPRAHVLLCPVRVQGDGAADEIAAAIRDINRHRPDVDVIIAGRGGGSIEDLWAFNEEAVARAIYESQIPVVSAVGHETDFTIADFVADVRAATPTDAGVKVAPKLEDLEDAIEDLRRKLRRALESRAQMARERLRGLEKSYALRSPERVVRTHRQRLDDLAERLAAGLRGLPPRHRPVLQRLDDRLRAALRRTLDARRRAHDTLAAHLAALNPQAILQRGYSITYDERGAVLRRADAVKEGERIRTVLGKGDIKSRVEEKHP